MPTRIDAPKTFERLAKHSKYRHDMQKFSERIFPTSESLPDSVELQVKNTSHAAGKEGASFFHTYLDNLTQGLEYLFQWVK